MEIIILSVFITVFTAVKTKVTLPSLIAGRDPTSIQYLQRRSPLAYSQNKPLQWNNLHKLMASQYQPDYTCNSQPPIISVLMAVFSSIKLI